jgi:hypothetical protein
MVEDSAPVVEPLKRAVVGVKFLAEQSIPNWLKPLTILRKEVPRGDEM